MKAKFEVTNKYAMSEIVKAIIDKYVPVIYGSELRKQ